MNDHTPAPLPTTGKRRLRIVSMNFGGMSSSAP
jgi:hypothetical protein